MSQPAPLGTQLIRDAWLWAVRVGYEHLARPVIFRSSAQTTHEHLLHWLRRADAMPGLPALLSILGTLAQPEHPVTVGGVTLPTPFILAAGLVKGDGFDSEEDALRAVESGHNIMPGWRSMPSLAGVVEFGSFTRWPRLGNPGTVVWRDVATRSTQNRVGLRNPGVHAAAQFLAARRDHLPRQFGINIAVSPGVLDPAEQAAEVQTGLAAFVERGVIPTWFTINLSCPNTESDPGGFQTADQARAVCGGAVTYLHTHAPDVPLWVKLGPDLSADQYSNLLAVFAEVGVRAVIATNTIAQPTPDDPAVNAGVGGGRLHAHAVQVTAELVRIRDAENYPVDIIGCGGVIDGPTYQAYQTAGVQAVQYWSALVYRGPWAASVIAREAGLA